MAKWRDKQLSGRERAQARQQEREMSNPSGGGGGGKNDWRKKGSAERARRNRDRPEWAKTEEADPNAWRRARRRIAIFLVGAVLVGALVAFIMIVPNNPDKTSIVVLNDANGAGDRLFSSPANQAGASDAFDGVANRSMVVDEGIRDQLLTDEDLDSFVTEHKIDGGGPSGDVAVFIIPGIGVVGPDGLPYLLDASRDPFDGDDWISIADFLDRLKDMKDRKGNDLKKVIFLDSSPIDPAISPELMVDRFPSAIDRLFSSSDNDFESDGIYLILSHETGQRSWYSPELGHSVFMHYTAMGLAGGADGCLNATDKDSTITVDEIAAFVHARVRNWVGAHRGTLQSPVLFPRDAENADEVGVIFAKLDEKLPTIDNPTTQEVERRAAEVEEKWVVFENRLAQENLTIAEMSTRRPDLLPRFENLMIQLESLVPTLSSSDYSALKDEVDEVIVRMFDFREIRHDRPSVSLAESIQRGEIPSPRYTLLVEGKNIEERWLEAQNSEEEDEAKRQDAIDQIRGNLVRGELYHSLDVRYLMWRWMRSIAGGPNQAQLNEAVAILADFDDVNGNPGLETTEIKFLQLLSQYVDWAAADGAEISRSLEIALQCRDRSEQVLYDMDQRAIHWVIADIQITEEARRRAEDLIYVGKFAAASAQLEPLMDEYQRIEETAALMASLIDLHDEALRKLPYIGAFEFRRLSVELGSFYQPDGTIRAAQERFINEFRAHVVELRELTELTDRLGREIYRTMSEGDSTDVARIDNEFRNIDKLDSRLAEAEARFINACDAMLNDEPGENPSALVEVYNALLCPLATDSGQRFALRTRYREVLNIYDQDENPPSIVAVEEVTWQENLIEDYDEIVASFYTDSEINEFYRAESRLKNEISELLEQLPRATWDLSDSTSLLNLLLQLETAWVGENESIDRGELRDRLFGVEHFLRRSAPYLAANTSLIKLRDNPRSVGVDLLIVHRDLFELAMAERAIDDFWGNGPERRRTEFFFAQLSKAHLDAVTTREERRTAVETLRTQQRDLALHLRDRGSEWLVPLQDSNYTKSTPSEFEHRVALNFEPGLPGGTVGMYIVRLFGGGGLYPLVDGSGNPMRMIDVNIEDGRPATIPPPYKIPVEDDFARSEEFQVRLRYRGHETFAMFRAKEPQTDIDINNIRVQFTPMLDAESTVQVSGGSESIADVIIVVDCSRSMDATIDGENGPVTRMKLARNIAKSLLERLEEAGNYRVGIMAYGHRVRYSGVRLELAYSPNWPADEIEEMKRNGIRPAHDVDMIFELDGSITSATTTDQYDEMIAFLLDDSKLSYWGQTPLYESMMVAAQHLQDNGIADSERHIVIISDGLNEPNAQDLPNPDGWELGKIAVLDDGDVQSLISPLDKCRIHLALYGVDESDEDKEPLRQLVVTSNKQGDGDDTDPQDNVFIDSDQATFIEDRIDDFIKPNLFEIARGNSVDPTRGIEMGSNWTHEIESPGRHMLGTTIENVQNLELFLYGGEDLNIELVRGTELRIVPLTEQATTKRANLFFNNSEHRISMVEADERGVVQEFKFAFEAWPLNSRHTDRPGFLMLDVVQSNPAPDDPYFYRLYDYDFVLRTSYPIVRFPIVNTDPEARYQLTLRAVPMGAFPTDFAFQRPVADLPTEDAPIEFEYRGVTVKTWQVEDRNETTVEVEVTGDDIQVVRDLLVRIPTVRTVHREFSPDGKTANYSFFVRKTDLTDASGASMQLEMFEIDAMFSADNGAISRVMSFP